MDPNHVPVADSSPYHDALAECAAHWALDLEDTELIRDGINHVFGTVSDAGQPVIIRISDGSVRERSELLGELLWLDHLIRHGCTVTTPIESRRGEWLETIELDIGEMHVSCFKRFAGQSVNPATNPAWNDELLQNLGREIARVHRASDDLQLPADENRKPWCDDKEMQIPDPLLPCYNPRVTEKMAAFLEQVKQWPTPSRQFGLVHRDLHAGNFLVEDGRIEIIDFDLGCYGWRTWDFVVLLFGHYYYPSLRVPHASPELAGHVLSKMVSGYREEYTLEREQLDSLDEVMLLPTILNYLVTKPAIEHWQTAFGNPATTVAESLAWIEQFWLSGERMDIDTSQI
ncbi:phosphotransferase [Aeoliella sp. ICT_H6.2]|uniref:Phosphotransferase n=1 Tax=Aeoliella straminimaris TaxID=2954799 RepID=A0A9X2FCN8_9BACT|nr:phosphotransferase [Aeoliella straminimaris]MCO6043536.1 phosphotransferase [Aeoliella straminimaris]